MRAETHPLADYLAVARESREAFAVRAGTTLALIDRILDEEFAPDLGAARRVVAACGGALELRDLISPRSRALIDGAFGTVSEIHTALLAAVIEVVAPEAFALQSDEAAFAAAAAADIFDALSGVTGLSRADRLAEALRPALQESFEARPGRRDPGSAASEAARLYLAAEARLSA